LPVEREIEMVKHEGDGLGRMECATRKVTSS
jgi:hypothetical protein